MNSVRYMMQAIEYEAQRQVDVLEAGGKVDQETRLFDPSRGETRSMRSKEDAHDYRYFPDPDLLPLELDDAFLDECKASLPELPDAKRARYAGAALTWDLAWLFGAGFAPFAALWLVPRLGRFYQAYPHYLVRLEACAEVIEDLGSGQVPDALERLHEEFKRRIKTQTVLPSAATAAMLFWALLASGQITMRKVDGWETLTQPLQPMPLDLAA